jgi:hypothetical protein
VASVAHMGPGGAVNAASAVEEKPAETAMAPCVAAIAALTPGMKLGNGAFEVGLDTTYFLSRYILVTGIAGTHSHGMRAAVETAGGGG